VYILAFSVIMLNTDAHNPNIKKKMTEQEFVRTNRGINEGQDIVPEYLIDIYCRIVTNEIKMEHESFPDALKMGWLWIKGTHAHTTHTTHTHAHTHTHTRAHTTAHTRARTQFH
jgi:Sec7-like guanine-nucleotide exchange factor